MLKQSRSLKGFFYLALEDQSVVGLSGSPSVSWCWLKTSRRGCLCMVVVSLCMVVVVNMMEGGPLHGGGEHEPGC